MLFHYNAAPFNAVVTEALLSVFVDALAADQNGHRRGTANAGSGEDSARAFRHRNILPWGQHRLSDGHYPLALLKIGWVLVIIR